VKIRAAAIVFEKRKNRLTPTHSNSEKVISPCRRLR